MNLTKHVLDGRRTAAQPCLRLAFYIFLGAGLLAGGYATYIIADAQTYQAIQLRQFAPIVDPHLPGIGERIGEIEIPRLVLRAVILQGDSSQVLLRGVGHLPNTAMPGELGNIGLAGHRHTLFRPLRHIRARNVIILHSSAGRFRYQVGSIRIVSPQDSQVLNQIETS